MKNVGFIAVILVLLSAGCAPPDQPGGINTAAPSPAEAVSRTADHSVVQELWKGRIPEADIISAKQRLVIGYGHTSHGSQITDGLRRLSTFADSGGLGKSYTKDLFGITENGADGTLYLKEGDGYGSGILDHDAGYHPAWVNETEEFLKDPANSSFNVIMWSWCGQVSGYNENDMRTKYLEPMADFEKRYPDVVFVYMTGHLDGTGEHGNLHIRNEQIREFCRTGDRWLFDFADIESHDPDGKSYLSKNAKDDCSYDSDGNGSLDANWAQEWQNSHTKGVDWFSCGAAHSEPLNANMKAYAAWWLFTRIADERFY